MDDIINETVVPLQKFAKSSQNLLTKCTKPDWKGQRCVCPVLGCWSLTGLTVYSFVCILHQSSPKLGLPLSLDSPSWASLASSSN